MNFCCFTNTKDDIPWQDLEYPAKLYKMLKDGFMVDCCFVVGPCGKSTKKIYGHKLIFAMESPVFERMLCGDFKEAKSDSIPLPEDDINDFKRLREVLYSSERTSLINSFGMDILGLYKLAEKYLVTSISKVCVDQLQLYLEGNPTDEQLAILFDFCKEYNIPSLNAENAAQRRGYPLGSQLYTLKPAVFTAYITGACKQNIMGRYGEIFKTIEGYLTINKLIPKFVLNQNDKKCAAKMSSNMTELEKFELWKTLLALVKFSLISHDPFNAELLRGSKILTWRQKFQILEFVSKNQHRRNCQKPQNLDIF